MFKLMQQQDKLKGELISFSNQLIDEEEKLTYDYKKPGYEDIKPKLDKMLEPIDDFTFSYHLTNTSGKIELYNIKYNNIRFYNISINIVQSLEDLSLILKNKDLIKKRLSLIKNSFKIFEIDDFYNQNYCICQDVHYIDLVNISKTLSITNDYQDSLSLIRTIPPNIKIKKAINKLLFSLKKLIRGEETIISVTVHDYKKNLSNKNTLLLQAFCNIEDPHKHKITQLIVSLLKEKINKEYDKTILTVIGNL